MSRLTRPLASSLIRPLEQEPVLTVVIPTYNRPAEMAYAVESIASQIDGDLDGKIEILISDNASGPETQAALERLAARYPSVNYLIHAENEGGLFQIYAAPHRARGRWTWVFGDDDALAPGGLRPIVDVLEREQPGFLTINRQVWDKTFTNCVSPTRHDLSDMRFETFLELLQTLGFDQLSFLTSQIYATAPAKALEIEPYLCSFCRYSQMAYYLEAYYDQPAYYLALPVVLHRWDQSAEAVHAANFHHLATLLPELVQRAADLVGLEPGLFERINGRRQLIGQETRNITFVDNIMQNLWRSVAIGTDIPEVEWTMLHQLSTQWRPDRADDLQAVHETHGKVAGAFQHYQDMVANHNACLAEQRAFSPEEVEVLRQSETAIRTLQGHINDARKMAFEMARRFD